LVAANIGWHIGFEERRVNVLTDVLSSAEELEVVPVASDEERQVLDARRPISQVPYAYKHGYSAEAIARRSEISALIPDGPGVRWKDRCLIRSAVPIWDPEADVAAASFGLR
jgi:hypothetical protein